MPTLYKKSIVIGKVVLNKSTRRHDYTAKIDVEIKGTEERPVLSICGEVYHTATKSVRFCGQCIDEIAGLVKTKKMRRIEEIWKRWHLNDMHSGCEHQRDIEALGKESWNHIGDVCTVCSHKFGSDWQYEALPQDVIDEVKSW